MNSYGHKQRRAMRRRNHIARDLAERKYRQRRVENKKKRYDFGWEIDEDAD
jgi:hypothetical protein